jgi:hypothetical protein
MTKELLDKANELHRILSYTQKQYDNLLWATTNPKSVTITIQAGVQNLVIPMSSESAKKFLNEYRTEVLDNLTALQDEINAL